MSKNSKKRIVTSIGLFLLIYFAFLNKFVLGYFVLVTGLLSILEFNLIMNIILKNNEYKKFFNNLVFILYIFIFCTIFFIFSNFLYFKILLFMILLTCVASDIGGFIFGKTFKGPKLSKISPNKTISGAIGSLVFSITFIMLLTYYLTKNFELSTIILGFIISISCQLGDLFFSYLKRKSFLKDTGNFLPGHGGILDRVDGILLGLPMGFLTLSIIY